MEGYWCGLDWIGLGELKILNWTVNKGGEVIAIQLSFISGYLLRQFHSSQLVLNSKFTSQPLEAELGCALRASPLVGVRIEIQWDSVLTRDQCCPWHSARSSHHLP